MKPTDLRSAFCLQTACTDSAFVRAFFWQGLHRHAVPLAFLIRLVAPAFFRNDDEFIRYLGNDRSMEEVEDDIDRFEYGNRVRSHWLRTGLRLHLDPQRITALARRCLESSPLGVRAH